MDNNETVERAKISFSIPIKDVPNTIIDMLSQVDAEFKKNKFGELLSTFKLSSVAFGNKKDTLNKLIERINEHRENLMELDIRCQECTDILKGYIESVYPELNNKEEPKE